MRWGSRRWPREAIRPSCGMQPWDCVTRSELPGLSRRRRRSFAGSIASMRGAYVCVVALALCGCGVSKSEYDAKVQEATAAKQEADAAKQQLAQLQQQVSSDDQQVAQLKGALGLAQAQAITDDQKQALDDAKHALQEAQERGKLLDDLTTKFKKMIDAGHLKVTTRHGRIVLQLHNDVLFATGDADLKPDGKQAIG